MKTLDDKVALITGGALRLGRELAIALAREGCDIVIHYRESAAEAKELAGEIRAMDRQAWLVCGDFNNIFEPEAVMRTAWEMAGWVDVLVNNAAEFSQMTLLEMTSEEIEEIWRINTLAPIILTKTLADLASTSEILPDDYCGKVINILDRRVSKPDRGCLPYWLTKKGLEAFTLGGALELAPRITVNAVAPGPVLAPDSPDLLEPAGPMPLAVRCLPADVVDAVLFLAKTVAVTGQVVYVDSGQHLL